jgi:hypothetical protein
MRIKIDDVEYEFGWKHENPVTLCICTIKQADNVADVKSSHSTLSKHDQYNKDIGRKVSLNRMLFMLFPPKADDMEATRKAKVNRELVWNLYFSRLPVDKQPLRVVS